MLSLEIKGDIVQIFAERWIIVILVNFSIIIDEVVDTLAPSSFVVDMIYDYIVSEITSDHMTRIHRIVARRVAICFIVMDSIGFG